MFWHAMIVSLDFPIISLLKMVRSFLGTCLDRCSMQKQRVAARSNAICRGECWRPSCGAASASVCPAGKALWSTPALTKANANGQSGIEGEKGLPPRGKGRAIGEYLAV